MKKTVNVFEFRTGFEFLTAVHKSILDKNPRFSLRSFAQKIDIDQSTLVRYFSKERLLSPEKTQVIATSLQLNEVETHYFKLLTVFGDKGEFDILNKLRTGFLFEDSSARLEQSEGIPFLSNINLTMDFKAHLILQLQSMTQDLDIRDVVSVLTRFFETDEKQVAEFIHKLIQIGILDAQDKKRRKELLKKIFLSSEQLPRDVGLRFHSDALNIAQQALKEFDHTDVEIYSSLIAIKKEGRAKMLDAIKHIHAVISEYHTEENADDIFLVSSFMVNLTENLNSKNPVPAEP